MMPDNLTPKRSSRGYRVIARIIVLFFVVTVVTVLAAGTALALACNK